MPAPKGNRYSPGRPKGRQSDATRSVNEAVLLVFKEIGGHKAFAEWARQNQELYYTKIYSKMIKQNMDVSIDGGLEISWQK